MQRCTEQIRQSRISKQKKKFIEFNFKIMKKFDHHRQFWIKVFVRFGSIFDFQKWIATAITVVIKFSFNSTELNCHSRTIATGFLSLNAENRKEIKMERKKNMKKTKICHHCNYDVCKQLDFCVLYWTSFSHVCYNIMNSGNLFCHNFLLLFFLQSLSLSLASLSLSSSLSSSLFLSLPLSLPVHLFHLHE